MSLHARFAGVTRVYASAEGRPDVHALGPIDLDILRGEFLAVVGPSGCGKSTFIDVLSGLAAPTTGTVSFENQLLAGEPPDGVGIVFQQDASFPWLSVRDNIGFGLKRRRRPASEIARRVDDALRLMGLTDFADAYPAQLSGGMRRRVCIARTLVLEPRLILLDEPFAALDAQTRLLMGDELLALWRASKATVVLITHALEEAALLADRIVVLSARPGRIMEVIPTGWTSDRSSTLLTDPRFGALTARVWSALREESLKALGRHGGAP